MRVHPVCLVGNRHGVSGCADGRMIEDNTQKRERTRRLGDLFVVVPAGMSRDGPNLGRRLYVRIDNWLGDR